MPDEPESPPLDIESVEPTPERILDLGDGVFARVLRVDSTDIAFDLGTMAGDVFTPTAVLQGVPPVAEFDQENPPDDTALAAHIADKLANPIPVVPRVVSRAQFMVAIRRELDLVEADIYALISGMDAGETQETARDLFEHAREFHRNNATLLALAAAEGITSTQLDDVFRVAAALDLDS